jgi:hypothetical protein
MIDITNIVQNVSYSEVESLIMMEGDLKYTAADWNAK